MGTRSRLKSRIVDYLIYVACGLIFCAAVFIPMLFGIDMAPIINKGYIIGMQGIIIGAVGYELRDWIRTSRFWAYLLIVAFVQLAFAWWLLAHDKRLNTLTWVVLAGAETHWFTRAYRSMFDRAQSPMQ